MSDIKGAKRPVPEAPSTEAPPNEALSGLYTLTAQIELFEQLGDEPADHPTKKASKVHSLTQNTTHRKIRVGAEYQAALPPPPPAKK